MSDKTSAKDTFVVQAKHAGSRAYVDAGAGKPSEEKGRAFLQAVAAKHPSTSKFRLVKRTTTSTHTDAPLKASSAK
ncbi:MAG: hypothetical protein NVS3B1_06260 [Marmoricola sp.]